MFLFDTCKNTFRFQVVNSQYLQEQYLSRQNISVMIRIHVDL